MTQRASTFQHCRDCRSKLKTATDMRMASFCGSTCWMKYYRNHCRVCDAGLAPLMGRWTNRVNLCSRKCRNTYDREGQHLRGFSRSTLRPGYPPSQTGEKPCEKAHSPRVSEALFSGVSLPIWGAGGKSVKTLVPHPRTSGVYYLKPSDKPLMFTELEIKRLLTPPPKPKSIPLSLMGSTHQFPGAIPIDRETRKAIVDYELGGWLHDNETAAPSDSQPTFSAPLSSKDDLALPACIDRRVKLSALREAAA